MNFSVRDIRRACFAIAAIAFLYITRETWLRTGMILLLAAAFTLLLAPLCARLEAKGYKSGQGALVSILLFVLLLAIIMLTFVPYLITHTTDLVRRMTPTVLNLFDNARVFLDQWGIRVEGENSLPKLIASAVSPLTAGLARGGITLFTWAGHLAFSLVIAYYLLAERRSISNHLILCIPLRMRTDFLSALLGCKNAVLSYAAGVIKTSLFISGATFIALVILGVKDALILSLFMGIFEILPYIGPVLGAVPILISALPMGMTKTLLALLLVFVIQQLENSLIGPYFTASSTSIHPLAAIISVFVFGSLFGVMGILLAVPIIVIARSVLWSVRSASIRAVS